MAQRLLGIGVNEFPVSTPLAAPTPWIGPTISGTATYNGTTTVSGITPATPNTQFTGVDNFVVGQAFSGQGVPAGTTIATIASATSITLSAASTFTGSGNFQTGAQTIPGSSAATGLFLQSQFAVFFQGNASEPIVPLVSDSYFSVPNLFTFPLFSGIHYYIPPGQGMALLTAPGTTGSLTLQYQNTAVGTWTTLATVAATATSFVPYVSDGLNIRVTSTWSAGTAATVLLIQTN